MNKKSFIALSLIFTHCVNVNAATRLEVDFDHTPLGHYQSKTVEKDWPNLQWQSLLGRAQIVSSTDNEHKKVLKVDFPKGAVGPQEGGGQFLMSLPATEELWLSYHVKFAHNFDFRLGGKLPGLSSGGSKYTGGHIPTKGEGWSARYMWRQNGEGIIYLYYMDMPGKWGEDLALGEFHFKTEQWHTLTQHIRVNDMNESNGVLKVWVDGKKRLDRNNIRFRGQPTALIDSFYFSTFHGGNSAEWGPKTNSSAYFDNFIISSTPLINENLNKRQ